MTNPYQAPTTACNSDADQRRVWIALVPFFVGAAALVVAIGLWFGRPFSMDLIGGWFGVLGVVLVFDLPVCTYVIIKWLGTGVPPDLVSELMMTTAEAREFHRNLRNRPQLDADAFYDAFYRQSGLPKHDVGQLRRILEDITGYDLAGLYPGDNLAYIDGEMDFADVLRRVERDFHVKLDWDEFRCVDVTFDSLLHSKLRCMPAACSDNFAQANPTDG